MTPIERYNRDLETAGFVDDPAQRRAVEALQALYDELLAQPREEAPARGVLGKLLGRRSVVRKPVQGLYLWGGVGRGKTYLMDTFFDCLPFPGKRRMHFHRFMHMVHGELKKLRDQQSPLTRVAEDFAADNRVLCFDEFYVSDITDAMILGGLLDALFMKGVTLVATSNIPPDKLYRDGLQRERFLPAIRLLETHTRVLNVDGGTDYRLRYLEQAEIYHTPADEAAAAALKEEFEHLAPEKPRYDSSILVEGRKIPVRARADDVVWFDYKAICEGPRSQVDYIEIAREFHTVIISGVPILDGDSDESARRFISLVDEFYDRHVKLLLSAAAPVEELYQGKRLAFEFDRTVSRLREMRSSEYLGSAHRV
ncbi:cell division protein ZapE [Natronocella acetinitrilica]|jgi:cell division protein ZapE|uniref:Cell division protein ZapE n=1 Tax=Natronocella acetinitrilica TaxID=414046 RepID=A0AAE3G3K5_9GAMM|nr:cell division protein ZapE [Natronocella acetinitrilica]MCP1675160.1 cell division protein ZapE [Natronocella acetinitrilica]